MRLFKGALVQTTEAMIIGRGYHKLSGAELYQRIAGKTVRGDYFTGRQYVSYLDEDGTVDGTNDLGAYCTGEWLVDTEAHTLMVKWNCSWDAWTGYAYDVDGNIQFYDCSTHQWRTTFTQFREGKVA